MSEFRIGQVEDRVSKLEEVVREMDVRLCRLEPKTVGTAPPIQQAPPRYEIPTPPSKPAAPLVNVQTDTEFMIGAQWLPRIGAGLLVLGIAFLIGLAVNRGWITPPMLFGGAVILCLSFIGFGQKMREEKEDFGQILTGIGSCGMFATLAGGHVYQNLYSGEVLVGTFIVWSLANLGYALWRESKSFLAIGVIGGFLGSVMPVSKDAHVLSLCLHAMILSIACMIIVRQKLANGAIGLFMASGLALFPVVAQTQLDWRIRVAAIYVTSFACLITYLKARRKSESVENRLVIALILGAAALSSFALKSGLEGTIQLLMASGLMGAMAYGYRKEAEVRDMLVGTALTVASLLAPVGLHTQAASLLYSGLAMLAAIIGGKWKFRSAFALSALYLCASVLMLVSSVADQPGLTRSMEVTMLVALLSASISIATAVRSDEESPYSLLAFLVAWASVTRLGSILIALPSDFNLANASITVAWVVYGTAILTWGFISSLRYHRYAGLTVLLLTVSKVLLIDMATATPELRVGVLLLVGLAMMFGGYAYIRRRHRQVKT